MKKFGLDAILNFPHLKKSYINNEIEIENIAYKKPYDAIKGVYYDKNRNKWYTKYKGKMRGYFKTKEEAEAERFNLEFLQQNQSDLS